MKIALVHSYFDAKHLEEVKSKMAKLGAPKIHAVWMECYNHWAALDGCHRLRAAKELGLTPDIIEVEYSDNPISSVLGPVDEDLDYTIDSVADSSSVSTILEFED